MVPDPQLRYQTQPDMQKYHADRSCRAEEQRTTALDNWYFPKTNF